MLGSWTRVGTKRGRRLRPSLASIPAGSRGIEHPARRTRDAHPPGVAPSHPIPSAAWGVEGGGGGALTRLTLDSTREGFLRSLGSNAMRCSVRVAPPPHPTRARILASAHRRQLRWRLAASSSNCGALDPTTRSAGRACSVYRRSVVRVCARVCAKEQREGKDSPAGGHGRTDIGPETGTQRAAFSVRRLVSSSWGGDSSSESPKSPLVSSHCLRVAVPRHRGSSSSIFSDVLPPPLGYLYIPTIE
ncbi:hypothetical protein B0H11DRAFT_2380485 [Mycena galericulata]|nr:hypothetical protein B0H11DRAFT_2380485 [Mycena galericulata]